MKVYKKPEAYFESFELAEHIAACDLKLNQAEGSCAAADQFNGPDLNGNLVNVFVTANFACQTQYEDYCYTKGGDNLATFMS